MTIEAFLGQILSYTALAFGVFFYIFACKYYIAILLALFGGHSINEKGQNEKIGVNKNHVAHVRDYAGKYAINPKLNLYQSLAETRILEDRGLDEPFVSIHLPFYNEKNVARRIILACIDMDYSNYEILVLDDSRDETIEILKEIRERKGAPTIKVIHRKDRRGFKGGALMEGLQQMDPRAEYIVVFDADFIPPQDIIRRFLWYFGNENFDYENNNNHRFAEKMQNYYDNGQNRGEDVETLFERLENWYERRRVAAVQGYQLHHLNKSENWLTRGVRAEYSGSYMVERVSEQFLGALRMISGSVFMLKADVVRRLGWTNSITEDWDLTIRLYLAGYKVVYTPLIQAAAEIPTTVRRLVQQRMRWAEGHTFAVKKYFWQVIKSPRLTFMEKLEFLYFAPYYLQSLFLLVGTICWMVGEILVQHPWFWTAALGWCLLINNFLALPLMSLAGLFLERKAREDFTGIFSFIVLSFLVMPFQAYAALRGLLEKEEGTWIRTLKTGTITDKVLQVKLRRLFSWILPKKKMRGAHANVEMAEN